MKVNLTKKATKVTLFACALLGSGLFAGSAHAQARYQGKFTLKNSVRWGMAVLPPGEYRISAPGIANGRTMLFVIQNATTGRQVALESSPIVEDGPRNDDRSELLVGTRGRQLVVYSFQVAELGESFIYDRTLAKGHGQVEAREGEAVRVLVAKK